jgi:hypothetical protein
VPTGDIPATSTCDPWTQDCPEGEKCVAYSSSGGTWDANKCVMVMGDGAVGDPCMGSNASESTDDCGDDSWCWEVNQDGIGVCRGFCTGTPDDPVCGANHSCSIANNGSITICLKVCDPLIQDCAAGTGCYWDGNSFICGPSTDMGIPEGDPCGFINDCAPGNTCVAAEFHPQCNGDQCCAGFCDLDDPTCVIAGTQCEPWFEEGTAPPGFESVGVCSIPA